jgi:hypothetical protein
VTNSETICIFSVELALSGPKTDNNQNLLNTSAATLQKEADWLLKFWWDFFSRKICCLKKSLN